VTDASCELLGRWHHWRPVEIIMDGPQPGGSQGLNHAVRVMRCERCGATSWRWTVATRPTTPTPPEERVRTIVHVRRTAPRPIPA
jgi:hypothetical protein